MAKCLQTISSLCLALTLSSSYEPTVCCQPTLPIACWEFARYTFCCKRIRSSENWSSITLELYGPKTDALAYYSTTPYQKKKLRQKFKEFWSTKGVWWVGSTLTSASKWVGWLTSHYFVIWQHMSLFSAACKMVQTETWGEASVECFSIFS